LCHFVAPTELRTRHVGIGARAPLRELRVERVCEQPGRAMLPAERDALWIHVLVEEEARRRIPGKRHLAEGELPVLARAPFRVGEVQIERLARIDVRERLVRRARIEALRSRRLDLDSQ